MKNCPFCAPDRDLNQRIVLEKGCLFLLKLKEHEVLEGSGIIVPRAHRQDIFALTRKEWAATSIY